MTYCHICGRDVDHAPICECGDEMTRLRDRVTGLEKNNVDLLCDREVADRYASLLATAIAAHFREDIGEHSDTNNPWDNALNLIEGTFCR